MKEQTWDSFWTGYQEPSKAEKFLIKERNNIIRNAIKNYLGDKKIRILEVGCGFASNSRLLNLEKNFDVFCIDSSKKVIEKVKKSIKNSQVMDARDLKFEDNYFDVVFSAGLIEHFKDPSPLTDEMIRVVKKSGIIITTVPGKYSLWQLFIRLKGKNWKHGYEEPYTLGKLRKVFGSKKVSLLKEGGLDPFSLNGALLKLIGIKTPLKKGLPNAYTEVYSIIRKN